MCVTYLDIKTRSVRLNLKKYGIKKIISTCAYYIYTFIYYTFPTHNK